MHNLVNYYLMMDSGINLNDLWKQYLDSLSALKGKRVPEPPPEVAPLVQKQIYVLNRMSSPDLREFTTYRKTTAKQDQHMFEDLLDKEIYLDLILPCHLLAIHGISLEFQVPEPVAASQYLRMRQHGLDKSWEALEREVEK